MSDIAQGALHVGKAVHANATGGAEEWDDLTADEQAQFRDVALSAMNAHAEWLRAEGYRISPPGAFPAPSGEEEARAMVKAAHDFLKAQERKRELLATPARKLILPKGLH